MKELISAALLRQFRAAGFDLSVKDDLVDIKNVEINKTLNKQERIKCYLDTVKNPYMFKVNDTVVRVRYGNEGCSLQEAMVNAWQKTDANYRQW